MFSCEVADFAWSGFFNYMIVQWELWCIREGNVGELKRLEGREGGVIGQGSPVHKASAMRDPEEGFIVRCPPLKLFDQIYSLLPIFINKLYSLSQYVL